MGGIIIRPVTEADAAELVAIYAPYVLETAVTYEYEVPSAEEFRGRIENTTKNYPYLAAEEEGIILGYAYASAFHPRAAFRWSAEATVYLKKEAHGRGIGRMLYKKLEDELRKQNVQTVIALIADPNPESVAFHEKMGYRIAGRLTNCAYKLGEWRGMYYMEKFLGDHEGMPKDFIPYPEIER
ncbi:MAG: N-acetyltransferase [Anaerotignum sp.]|nr:N-acetyltransferase [Anaerotignum sp.]